MTYPESVEFLYQLGNEMRTARFGLERIRRVLAALGDPQQAFQIVHVAGTNGKGSTCALLDAGLRAAGIRTGLNISPHLQEATERIQIDGRPVTEREFERAFNAVREAIAGLDLDAHPTYFEMVTAMALWLFRERGVEMAILETGLGGRLDATNVIEHPLLTVITPVDLDHQDFLGDSLEQIAAEKAGILKPGAPLVLAWQSPAAEAVILKRAAELGIEVIRAADFPLRDLDLEPRGSRFHLEGTEGEIVCPLPGEHQAANAATAVLALRRLGLPFAGIAEASWPGRLEHVAPNPDTILDGAHNPAGARALASYLQRFYSQRKIWMIFGVMRDKDVAQIAATLFPLAQELMFTAPAFSRSLPPEDLQTLAGRGEVAPDINTALDRVYQRIAAEDVLVITGSLYLVGEARTRLSRHSQGWPPMPEF